MHALYTDIVLCVSLSLHFRCRSLHLHGSQINRCYVTNSHCAPFFSCFSCISSFSIFLIFNFLFTFIIHIIRFPFSLCIISVKKNFFSFYFWGVFLSLVSFFFPSPSFSLLLKMMPLIKRMVRSSHSTSSLLFSLSSLHAVHVNSVVTVCGHSAPCCQLQNLISITALFTEA